MSLMVKGLEAALITDGNVDINHHALDRWCARGG